MNNVIIKAYAYFCFGVTAILLCLTVIETVAVVVYGLEPKFEYYPGILNALIFIVGVTYIVHPDDEKHLVFAQFLMIAVISMLRILCNPFYQNGFGLFIALAHPLWPIVIGGINYALIVVLEKAIRLLRGY